MEAIVDRNKIASLFNIPESYGDKVKVIILPAASSGGKSLHRQSAEMLRLQGKKRLCAVGAWRRSGGRLE